jgi:hypothetical protein
MAFKSASEEISRWADQCRRWALRASAPEQRLTLQSLERLLNGAAAEAELASENDSARHSRKPTNS